MSHVVKKAQLDRQVALLLGAKVQDVSAITEAFLVAARGELIECNTLRLDGLGQLRVYAQRGAVAYLKPAHAQALTAKSKKKYRVSFKKSRQLTAGLRERFGGAEVIKEGQMEKYGVDEKQADNEKVAAQGCPECGAKVERHGNVLACPTHGTEPFEKNK